MALTVNREVDHFVDQELRSYQVESAKQIFKGGFVGLSTSGHAQPLVAGDPFVGIAYEEMDNTSGQDGDLSVRVFTLGDFGVTLTGATVADIGRPVFASADDTLTVDAFGNSYVGLIQDVIAANEIVLRLDTKSRPIKTTNFEVADLPAGVDLPVSAIHGFDQGVWVVGVRVLNKTTASAGIDDSNPLTVTISTIVGNVAQVDFNSSNPFPGINAQKSMGSITIPYIGSDSVIRVSTLAGTTADAGAFMVQVDYV